MDIKKIIAQGNALKRGGKYNEAIALYEDALKSASDEHELAELNYELSRAYLRNGEGIKAQERILNAIELAEKLGDDDLLTRVYTSAIDVGMYMGNLELCEKYIKFGYKHVLRAKPESQFNFYNIVGIYSFDRGKIGTARNNWEECLKIAKSENDPKLVAIAYNNLGEVYRIKDEFRKALENYRLAYENSKKSEDFRGVAINLLNMGDVSREAGDIQKAERYLRESVELYKKHKDMGIASNTYGFLAIVLADSGAYEEAKKFAEEAVNLAKKLDDKPTLGEATLRLGYVYEKMGDYRKAMRVYNEARNIFVKIAHKVFLSECELAIGRVLLSTNMPDAARFHLEEAKKIAEEIGEFKIVRKANALLVRC